MNKERNGMSIGLGIPTILVIFVVLGMSILSILTYLKSNQNEAVIQKEIEYTTSYYEADAKAKYILSNDSLIDALNQEKIEYTIEDEITTFKIPMNDKQCLVVCVEKNTVQSYRIESEG